MQRSIASRDKQPSTEQPGQLKRAIQRRVLDPLALRILEGDFREGDQVEVDARAGEIRFLTVAEPVMAG